MIAPASPDRQGGKPASSHGERQGDDKPERVVSPKENRIPFSPKDGRRIPSFNSNSSSNASNSNNFQPESFFFNGDVANLASDRSDITTDSSIGNNSVVSISQMSVSQHPKIPVITAFLANPRLVDQSLATSGHSKSPARTKVLLDHIGDDDTRESKSFGEFTYEQVKKTFNFITKALDTSDLTVDKTTEVSIDKNYFTSEDFEASFRKLKRAQKRRAMEEEARKFMRTFRFLLQLANKTPDQWFVETDTTPDLSLTWSEFEAGMEKLCKDLGGAMFSKNGLVCMLRYMDQNCVGELSPADVKSAFKRIKLPSKSVVILTESGPVMNLLQQYMNQRAARVQDLFNIIDSNKSNNVTLPIFCVAIERIHGLLFTDSIKLENILSIDNRPNVSAFEDKYPNLSRARDTQKNGKHLKKKTSASDDYLPQGKNSSDVGDNISETNKSAKKERIPLTQIRYRRVDSGALTERKKLLQGLHVRLTIPLPVKVNYSDIVKKGVQKYDPYIKHFDSTLKTGLMLYNEL
jgi:hypothetical protein